MTKYDIAIFVTIAAAVALLLRIIQEIFYAREHRKVARAYDEAISKITANLMKQMSTVPHEHVFTADKDPNDGHRITLNEIPKEADGHGTATIPARSGQ